MRTRTATHRDIDDGRVLPSLRYPNPSFTEAAVRYLLAGAAVRGERARVRAARERTAS